MSMKKAFLSLLTAGAIFASNSLPCLAATDVDSDIERYGFYFEDRIDDLLKSWEVPAVALNCDRRNPDYGNEHDLLRITAEGGDEEIDVLEVGEVYEAHIYLCAHSKDDALPAENVKVRFGGFVLNGEEFRLNVYVDYGEVKDVCFPDDGSIICGSVSEGCISYSQDYLVADTDRSKSFTVEALGDARLLNQGLLNGTAIDYELSPYSGNISMLVGYDTQDGLLPSGVEHACEVVFKMQLTPIAEDELLRMEEELREMTKSEPLPGSEHWQSEQEPANPSHGERELTTEELWKQHRLEISPLD